MALGTAGRATRSPHGEGYSKGRERRQNIIRTASAQFAQNGFDGATMLDIAAACGISRAGLFHHFADKEALLTAVLEERDREDQERFLPYVAAPSGGIGVLRGIVDLAGHNRLVPGLIDLFVRLSSEASGSEHPAHAYFTQRYQRIRSGTARALRTAARAGYLNAGVDPAEAALDLTALMDGLQAQWLFDPRVDMASHMRRAVDQLLNPAGRRAFDAFALPPAQ
ncbi:TetR/AcrR family transcriptional regulator [Gryllotalpicola reticulitermitis]|uniref:TetR/AcrR family transcriptional regulator n=1 Tax=Gryllotalpicola reticulitermitis TaxID=1184153 RepID=A0ABV8Q541_9MICO